MNTTVPPITTPKSAVSVLSVPTVSGTSFFAKSEPQIASWKMIGMNRPISITSPQAMFHGTVLSPRPSKPEPLLADDEVNS